MAYLNLAGDSPPTHREMVGRPRHQLQNWLGKLIGSPAWEESPLQQRETWLSIYLERT